MTANPNKEPTHFTEEEKAKIARIKASSDAFDEYGELKSSREIFNAGPHIPVSVKSTYNYSDKSLDVFKKPDVNFEIVSVSDVIKKPQQVNFQIKPFMEQNSFNEIFGDSGTCKSFIAQSMAYSVACGIPWFGHDVEQGNVLYLAGEGFIGLGRRFKALTIKHGIEPNNLFTTKIPASLIEKSNAKAIQKAITNTCPDPALIVIDTWARNMGGGNENDTQDTSKVISHIDNYLRDSGATIIEVHHSGHSDKDRSRGNSALKGALDNQYKVTYVNDVVTMTNTKTKDIEPPESISFELKTVETGWLNDEDEPITSAVLEQTNYVPVKKEKKLSHRDNLALRALRQAKENHGVEPTHEMKNKYGGMNSVKVVELEHWREAYYPLLDVDGGQDAKKKSFQRVRGKLAEMGKIVVFNDHFWEIHFDSLAGQDGT